MTGSNRVRDRKLASPYDERPEPPGDGDLADDAYEREGER